MTDFESASCGPRALFMLLAHLGGEAPLEILAEGIPPAHRSMGKTNMASLANVAGAFADTRVLHNERGDASAWPSIPFIAHLSGPDHEHFAVACMTPGTASQAPSVWVCSPPASPISMSVGDFREGWSGVALFVGDEACGEIDGLQRASSWTRAGMLLGGLVITAGCCWRLIHGLRRPGRLPRAA